MIRKMTKLLTGFALAVGMFVCVGNTAMARTYMLSEILAGLHQYRDGNVYPHYVFEGYEETAFTPQLSAGPFFAPGDRFVCDIPGAYLLASNPEMDNVKKVRAIIAAGYGTYSLYDGAVSDQIGEGAPLFTSIYYSDFYDWDGNYCKGELYKGRDASAEGSPYGLFQSLHLISNEDEEAVRRLNGANWRTWGEAPKGLAKSYRGNGIQLWRTENGTLVYELHFKDDYDREPNAEQYYAEKAALWQAQEQAPAERDSFDAAYYAMTNPDIVAVLGTNADTLWQHYLTFGYAEGRKAHP